MKFDLDDWHDAILVNDGSLVLDFEEPYRRLRRLTFPADCRPKIWHSVEPMKRSVHYVELRSAS